MKALKWYFLVFFIVVGASAFIMADESGSQKPILVGVLAFGVVYVISTFWQDVDSKVFIISAFLFMGVAHFYEFVPPYLYVFTGIDIRGVNTYVLWAAFEGIIGIPVMTLVFRAYD